MSIGSGLHSSQYPLQILDLDVQPPLLHPRQNLRT